MMRLVPSGTSILKLMKNILFGKQKTANMFGKIYSYLTLIHFINDDRIILKFCHKFYTSIIIYICQINR